MAEPKIETIEQLVVDPVVESASRLESFTVNHPRTAKVVGIAAITAATLGAVAAWKEYKQEDDETEVRDENVIVLIDDSSKTD